jgi:hypothetical protein
MRTRAIQSISSVFFLQVHPALAACPPAPCSCGTSPTKVPRPSEPTFQEELQIFRGVPAISHHNFLSWMKKASACSFAMGIHKGRDIFKMERPQEALGNHNNQRRLYLGRDDTEKRRSWRSSVQDSLISILGTEVLDDDLDGSQTSIIAVGSWFQSMASSRNSSIASMDSKKLPSTETVSLEAEDEPRVSAAADSCCLVHNREDPPASESIRASTDEIYESYQDDYTEQKKEDSNGAEGTRRKTAGMCLEEDDESLGCLQKTESLPLGEFLDEDNASANGIMKPNLSMSLPSLLGSSWNSLDASTSTNRGVRFSDTVHTRFISGQLQNSLPDDDRMFYKSEDFAQFRYEAFMEKIGLNPDEFD